jgi:hypothetical protein
MLFIALSMKMCLFESETLTPFRPTSENTRTNVARTRTPQKENNNFLVRNLVFHIMRRTQIKGVREQVPE